MGIALILDKASIKDEPERDYIGASIIGKECLRDLWYSMRYPTKNNDPRVQRIFDMGNIIEDYIIDLFKRSGIEVWTKDNEGKQFGFIDGNVAGHWDGVIKGIPESTKPHLLEIKSANDKRFKSFLESGCKATSLLYWVQVQVYMHYSGLDRCLFVAMNKDNQELYFERIPAEKNVAKMYVDRANAVNSCNEPPERKYTSSTFWKCRFCNYNERCWNENN